MKPLYKVFALALAICLVFSFGVFMAVAASPGKHALIVTLENIHTRGIGNSTVDVFIDGVRVQTSISSGFTLSNIAAGSNVEVNVRCDCNRGIRFDAVRSEQVSHSPSGMHWNRGNAMVVAGHFRATFIMPAEDVTLAVELEDLPSLTGVAISPGGRLELAVGETLTLSSSPIPTGTQTRQLGWHSTDPNVASVIATGGGQADGRTAVVTAVAPGVAEIVVSGSRDPGNWNPVLDSELVEARVTVFVTETDAQFLQARVAGILRSGFAPAQLTLSANNNATLTMILDDREFVLATNVNNRNVSGQVMLPDGSGILDFDIRGNGSNVRTFNIS